MPVITENELGKVTFSEQAIASLAGLTVVECYGVVGMASTRATDGLYELLKRENLDRGVTVTSENGEVSIDLYIIVQYGISINAVCTSVLETVKYNVEKLLHIPVRKAHVYVQSVRI